MRRSPIHALAATLLAATLVLGAGACSSDDVDNAKDKAGDVASDVATDVNKGADAASARGQAEALRASLKGNDTADEQGIRSVDAIRQTAEDLPGDPDVSGIDDGDGDGLDDDGKVQVTVDDASACLTLPESGEDTTVTDGDC